jgi:hypothetical protein
MLANVGEEGHELETIPFLQGADRKALITRKLGQHFLGSPLASAFRWATRSQAQEREAAAQRADQPGSLRALAEVPRRGRTPPWPASTPWRNWAANCSKDGQARQPAPCC